MSRPIDEWPKIRRTSQHFGKVEIDFIAQCFRDGWKPRLVAQQLQCATRTIQVHFMRLRGAPARKGAPSRFYKSKPLKRKPDRASRFYRSDFVPT